MSLSIVYSRAQVGIHAPLVTVETHLSNGLPSLTIVGLPETAVRESKERVRSALINSGFDFPTRRITINLAPADLPKQGGRYDLAIAISILIASGQLASTFTDQYEFVSELGLTGELRKTSGVLPSAIATFKLGKSIIVAKGNAPELSLNAQSLGYGAQHLNEVCLHLTKEKPLAPITSKKPSLNTSNLPDLKDVKGQLMARQALEVSAAGRHNLLFYGPPGTGKSMLASRLPSILPNLTEKERIEVLSIYSLINNASKIEHFYQAPFRAPHHTASPTSLVGGGVNYT